MSAVDTSAIERFIALVKKTSQQHSTDRSNTTYVRVTLAEATVITSELAVLMGRLARLEHEGGMEIEVAADGGTLR